MAPERAPKPKTSSGEASGRAPGERERGGDRERGEQATGGT